MDANVWPGLELKHLVALHTVAQTGTFGRAAHQLGYTQSAMSQQIAALEALVGHRLVERSRGQSGVELTEAVYRLTFGNLPEGLYPEVTIAFRVRDASTSDGSGFASSTTTF